MSTWRSSAPSSRDPTAVEACSGRSGKPPRRFANHLTSSSVARRPQTPVVEGRRPDDPIKARAPDRLVASAFLASFLSPSPPRIPPPSYSPSSEMANAASGVAVNDECKLKFIELQSKRLHRFITYKVENQKEIIVDKIGDRAASYEDFTSSLPENDCRYAIYDFDFVTAEDVQKSRIFYILWSPDTARVRSKMLYASSNENFKRMLNGIQVELQATDAGDISIDAIKERAR